MAPKLAYQAYIADNHEEATRELDADLRKSLRSVFRSADNPPPLEYLASTSNLNFEAFGDSEPEPIVFMSKEEEDYLVEQYSFQGFGKTLQFYLDQNRRRSHEFAASQGNFTIPCPVLAILPTKDSVAYWPHAMKLIGSEKFLPNLVVRETPTAHNPQLERPEEFNQMVEEFLNNILEQTEAQTSEDGTSVREEL
ncbi:hypothetical protein FRC02_005217 [Tulasnella sp. 418]|nr:hypothetical protein FRC02_005217 [Tulasnella sp. 418]